MGLWASFENRRSNFMIVRGEYKPTRKFPFANRKALLAAEQGIVASYCKCFHPDKVNKNIIFSF